MKLFNEIYGTYYRIAAAAIEKKTLTEKDIYSLISEYGTEESPVGLSPLLIPSKNPGHSNDWGFFERSADGTLKSIFRNIPKGFLTNIEKRWLKAKLSDRRIKLFMTDETLAALEKELADVRPLYQSDLFRCYDRFADGDDMSDPEYRKIFRICLSAYKSKEPLFIRFLSGRGNDITATVIPIKLEYSYKNDKFRIYCRQIGKGNNSRKHPFLTINIGRIEYAEPARNNRRYNMPRSDQLCFNDETETIEVRVTEERNAVERFMLEFASYSKVTVRDPETGECMVRLQCRTSDETELLIRLLGYGPAIEILSPPEFRAQAAKRVREQYERFKEAGAYPSE